jgi:hypothetical protein
VESEKMIKFDVIAIRSVKDGLMENILLREDIAAEGPIEGASTVQ